jgi:NAD(P)H-nitrite reductase large subunit
MNFVIVGSGPAGIFAAETIRKRDPVYSITMVSGDTSVAQSPVMLTYWMTGNHPRETLFFRDACWAKREGIKVMLNCRVVGLNTRRKKLMLADGGEISYGKLLIATGSSAISLPIPGAAAKGVFSLRYVGDAEGILKRVLDLREVAIIGGGFVGLKLACHLRERNLGVTILEKEPKLAPRMLDHKASLLIAQELEKHGIRIEVDVEVTEILNDNGWVTGVRLKDGRVFPSQSVIQAVGVRPKAEFLADSGIDLQGGVLVNERMETNVPGVYAAGDVTMTVDSIISERFNNATWPAASRQGMVAGWNMAEGNRTYTYNFPLNAINLFDLRIMAAGHPYYEEGSDEDIFIDQQAESYRKIVMRAGRMMGFIFLGDVSGVGFLLSLMKRRAEISHDPSDLLNSRVSLQDNLLPNLGYRHGELFVGPRERYR